MMCLDCHLCFPVVFMPRQNPNYEERLPRGKHTMPKHRCPYPECDYEIEDVKDKLASVLLTVHSNGTHVQTTSHPATQATTKVETVRRPTILSAGSSKEWSAAGKIMPKQQNSKTKT